MSPSSGAAALAHDVGEPVNYAAYKAFEDQAELPHEFDMGEIFAMSGARPKHNVIVSNLHFMLRLGLRGRPCQVVGGSQRLRVEATESAFYPDLTVICGTRQTSESDALAVVNPVALIEVLSDSTQGRDRGLTFDRYRTVPGLRHYVIVRQHEQLVDVYDREPDDAWTLRFFPAGATARLAALDVALPVDEIYEDIGAPTPLPPEAGSEE